MAPNEPVYDEIPDIAHGRLSCLEEKYCYYAVSLARARAKYIEEDNASEHVYI